MYKGKRVCVVVLGDIGRSPRMQYHSLSLSDNGFYVNIIGYKETKIPSWWSDYNIRIHSLVPFPSFSPKILNYIIKTLWQTFTLICALMFQHADYVLVQNPPAVPTLFTCWLYCVLTRAKFIIDWHNYAYTIMALNVGSNHILVKITQFMERFFGHRADTNLCVTNAMQCDLKSNWNIKAIPLHDKPSIKFRSISIQEKHNFLQRLRTKYPEFSGDNDHSTVFSEKIGENVELRKNRPALLISSTSWTEDEDFSVLLKALENYEESCQNLNINDLPKLICVITGKGPLKEYYIKLLKKQNMQYVTVITPWLEESDYPLMLASADLGICLHTSSSGLDLPMKVVDMFGCGLPVCAIDFQSLPELVQHKRNSYVFKDSEELTSQLFDWFKNFPNNDKQKQVEKEFKKEISKFQAIPWSANWNRHALPLFNQF